MARPQRLSSVIDASPQSSESARRVPTFVRRSFVILISYVCVFNLVKCVSAIQKGMIFVSVWYYDLMLLCITNGAPELLPVYIVVKNGWKLYLREFLLIIK